MKSAKKLVQSTVNLIITFSQDSVNNISDGIGEGDAAKVAINLILLLLVWALVLLTGMLILKLAIRNLHILIAMGFLAIAIYSALLKLFRIEEPAPIRKPNSDDYHAVLATIRPAVAAVAPALGLAPIYSHTDMEVDGEDQILPLGKVWRMKYKALKQNVAAQIDTGLYQRVIQAQIKTVLERENPSGFSSIRFQYGGKLLPSIIVDEVKSGDAYLYIFAVITSAEYLQQRRDWENRKNAIPTGTNMDDEDF